MGKNKVGFFKMLYLYYLTSKQEKALLECNVDKYMDLTAKHFKSFYGLNLNSTFLNNPEGKEFKSLLDRHGCMVVNVCFDDSPKDMKKLIYHRSMTVFMSNLTLRQTL